MHVAQLVPQNLMIVPVTISAVMMTDIANASLDIQECIVTHVTLIIMCQVSSMKKIYVLVSDLIFF